MTSDECSNDTERDDLRGVFPRDGTWGHKIVFEDYEEQKIHGWISPRLKEGDRFGYEMESGNIGVFEVIEVNHQLDPKDMFFGEVRGIGYADELGYDTSRGENDLRDKLTLNRDRRSLRADTE